MENFYVLQFLRENVVFVLVWLFKRHDTWQGCDLRNIRSVSHEMSDFLVDLLKDSIGVGQGRVARYTQWCTPRIALCYTPRVALRYTEQPAPVSSLLVTSFSSIYHKTMTRVTKGYLGYVNCYLEFSTVNSSWLIPILQSTMRFLHPTTIKNSQTILMQLTLSR